MRYFAVLVLAVLSFAQEARLGDAIFVPHTAKATAERNATGALNAIPNWYDTSNRSAVASGYVSEFVPLRNTPLGWTGDLTTGVPGTTSAAYQSAVTRSINWFRAMAGVPGIITLDPTLNTKAQQGALMMAANGAISHSPPPTWKFYTADGAEALANSNVCQGFVTDPGCVAQYIADQGANNYPAGHRRWIQYPPTNVMGTGDVPAAGNLWNALYVVLPTWPARPPTRDEFIAWPPKGYVPYQVVYPRWSFSYPDADFGSAIVTATRNGASVPVRQEQVSPDPPYYIGDNTLVFVLDNRGTNYGDPVEHPKPTADITYSIRVQNVLINGTPREFTYQVIVFDPATGASPSRAGIFRKSNNSWLLDADGSGTLAFPPDIQYLNWGGVPGEVPVAGDWTGNGKTRTGFYRNGLWVLDLNGNGIFDGTSVDRQVAFGGIAGDVPVVGDWNGDGIDDLGVFRAGFLWVLDLNGNGLADDPPFAFGGIPGDVPVVGDWNGDGKDEVGIFRAGFLWILDSNGNKTFDPGVDAVFAFGGIAGDVPVVGDWDNNGISDPGIVRQGFYWLIDSNSGRTWVAGVDREFPLGGIAGDKPIVGRW